MDAMNTEHVVVDNKGEIVFRCDTYEQAALWVYKHPGAKRYTIELMDKPSEPKTTPEQAAAAFIDAAKDLSRRRRLVVEPSLHIPRSKLKRISDRALARYLAAAKELEPTGQTSLNAEQVDKINNPSHYTQGGIECIDAMEAMLSPEEFIGYLRGNIFKYRWRYKDKNGMEDLKKANWYSAKLIELEELDGKHNP